MPQKFISGGQFSKKILIENLFSWNFPEMKWVSTGGGFNFQLPRIILAALARSFYHLHTVDVHIPEYKLL